MKKIFTLFAALVCGLALNAKTLYLNPGVWTEADAKFAMYYFNNETENGWSDFLTASGSIYSGEVPDNYANVIFVRLNPTATSPNWNDKWNQTADLVIPSDKNQYNITGWNAGDGNWSVYGSTPGGEGGEGGEGGQGGGGGQGGESESGEGYNFALIGSIGGNWNVTEVKEEYTFDERGRWTGTLGAHPDVPGASYVVIADHIGNQYKTKGWQGSDAQKVTLYWANGFEDSNVWQLPADQTLYLIMRSCTFKGEIEVERVDKATYDAYTIDWGAQGVEETTVGEKARKVFVNGQLHIIRGDKVFDATGREIK